MRVRPAGALEPPIPRPPSPHPGRNPYTIFTVGLREHMASAEGAPSFSPGLRGTSYPGFWNQARGNPEGVEAIEPEDENLFRVCPVFLSPQRSAMRATPG